MCIRDRVNAVACGAIDTEMNQFLEEDELISLIEEIPTGRLGNAEEVADLVYHLGYKGTYLTGQVIGCLLYTSGRSREFNSPRSQASGVCSSEIHISTEFSTISVTIDVYKRQVLSII